LPHLPKGVIGNADATGFGDALQPRRNVDPVTEDVIALDQHVAEMDADAPFHSAVAGATSIPFHRQHLQCDRALDGADHRAELDQHPVARRFHNPAAMLGDERVGGGAMLTQCRRGACLVEPHQARIARDISGKDRGETTFDGLRHGFPQPGDHNRNATASTEE
jgi:hypothetical protein